MARFRLGVLTARVLGGVLTRGLTWMARGSVRGPEGLCASDSPAGLDGLQDSRRLTWTDRRAGPPGVRANTQGALAGGEEGLPDPEQTVCSKRTRKGRVGPN
jgi:hypothetical protein